MISGILLAAWFLDAPIGAVKCGSERWAVKTLSDSLARYVDIDDASVTTIADLISLPTRSWPDEQKRHPPEEMTVYEVVGIVRVVKSEADHDVHIVLQDPDSPDKTLVAEVVDPVCAGAVESPHLAQLRRARQELSTLLRSGRSDDPRPLLYRRVRVRGVGFYDFPHGQAGRSSNNLELHPVLSIVAVD